MNNGGYHLIDLSDYTVGTTSVTITGLNDEIAKAAAAGKQIIITGMKTSSVSWDIFVPSTVRHSASNTYYLVGVNATASANYVVQLVVTSASATTLTQVDVTNPATP